MRLQLILAGALAATAAACATTSPQEAKRDVEAVVVDEQARAAAATVARRTGDADAGVAVADDVSRREPATPK